MEALENHITLPLYKYVDPVLVIRDVMDCLDKQARSAEIELIKHRQSTESRIFSKLSFYLSADIPGAPRYLLHFIDSDASIIESVKKCKAMNIRIGWTAEI